MVLLLLRGVVARKSLCGGVLVKKCERGCLFLCGCGPHFFSDGAGQGQGKNDERRKERVECLFVVVGEGATQTEGATHWVKRG